MEPVCWAGLVGIVAVAAIVGGWLKGTCKNSSCGCDSKKDEQQVSKESSAPIEGVDEKKEKAINDLIK